MFYDYSFTIQANTREDDPKRQDILLHQGIIHRVEIGFPAGCAGLAHLQIKHGLHQAWPTNPDGSFNDNDHSIPFNDYYPLWGQPPILTLHGWNEDDTYPHTIEVRLGILPHEVLMPEASFTAMFKKLMARLRV